MEPAIAAGVPSTGVSPCAKVWRGWSEKVAAPCSVAAARASSVVAPLTWPTRDGSSGCELLRDRSDRFVWHAEQDGGSAGSGFEVLVRHETDLDPSPLSGGGKRPAHASAADHGQRRAHGGGEVIPFQFPHRRYQTALLVRTSWRGAFRSAPVRSRPAAKYRERSWPPSQSKSRERPGTPRTAHTPGRSALFASGNRARMVGGPNYHQRGADLRVRLRVVRSPLRGAGGDPTLAERPRTSPARSAARRRSSASSRPHTRRCSGR